MSDSSNVRVFLSYAKENLDKVKEVYNGLIKRGLNVWFDNEHLGPGPWKPQIEKAISRCCYFVICISEAALRKTGDERPGFQDEELNRAYNIAEKQSDKDFTIVPVRIEECGRGDFRLSSFQQYDLFKDIEKHLDKLAINLGGSSLSDSTAKDERAENEKIIEGLMGKAEVAIFAFEYDKAIKFLDSILVLKPNSTNALINLGVAWYAKAKYDKAIECYQTVLKLVLKTFGKDHPNVAILWNNLGSTYKANGEHDKAIEYYEKALKSDLKTFGKDHPNVAIRRNNLGVSLYSKGEYDKAIGYYEKALKSDLNFFGENHPKVATRWNNLGEAWYAKGEYVMAIEYFEMALKAYLNTFDELHPYVSSSRFNLWKARNEILKFFIKVQPTHNNLEFTQKLIDEHYMSYVVNSYKHVYKWLSTENIGFLSDNTFLVNVSLDTMYHENVFQSDLKAFSKNHPIVAAYWDCLGKAWANKGEYDKAIGYYEMALMYFKKAGLVHHAKKVEENLKLISGL